MISRSVSRCGAILLTTLLCLTPFSSQASVQATEALEPVGEAQIAQPSYAIRPDIAQTMRREMSRLAIGVVVVAIGVGSLIVFLTRRDTALLYFGLATLLYGVRLFAGSITIALLSDFPEPTVRHVNTTITYWIPLPMMLFIDKTFGPGWRSSVRRLWQLWLMFALVATPLDWLTGITDVLTRVNNVAVIGGFGLLTLTFSRLDRSPDRRVVRALTVGLVTFVMFALNSNLSGLGLLPWGGGQEELGFLVFIGCLGYVLALRQFESERRLMTLTQELRTARQIQASILPSGAPSVPGLGISARYIPMTAVGGDFYDFIPVDDAHVGILVADVSGHGVPAALIASMVKVAVSSQAHNAAEPSRVLTEINRILCGNLEGQFVTATYVYLDLEAGRLVGASAGHPPTLLWKGTDRGIVDLGTSGIMLGYFPDAEYEQQAVELGAGDRVVLYTDGIIETTNRKGEFFDPHGLRSFISEHPDLSEDRFSASLLEHLEAWAGRDPEGGFEDDLTLVVVNVGRDDS